MVKVSATLLHISVINTRYVMFYDVMEFHSSKFWPTKMFKGQRKRTAGYTEKHALDIRIHSIHNKYYAA